MMGAAIDQSGPTWFNFDGKTYYRAFTIYSSNKTETHYRDFAVSYHVIWQRDEEFL